MRTFAVTLIALLAFEAQAHAEDVSENGLVEVVLDKLANKLLDRAFQADFPEDEDEDEDVACDSDNLDDSTLGKPGQLAVAPTSSRAAMPSVGPKFPVSNSAHPTLPQTALRSIVLSPQCTGNPLVCFATMGKNKIGLRVQPDAIKNTPYHLRGKCVTSPLSKELRAQYGIRNMPLRTDDVVKVMTGDHKQHEGKVLKVNRKMGLINIEGLKKINSKQQEYLVGMIPAKVQITKLAMSKDREAIIKRKQDGKIHQMRLKSDEESAATWKKNLKPVILKEPKKPPNPPKNYQTSGFLAPGPQAFAPKEP